MKPESQTLYQPDDLSGPEGRKSSPLFPPGKTIWINADDDENQEQRKQNDPPPHPLTLLPTVKNPASQSQSPVSPDELKNENAHFTFALETLLKALSGSFKQLRSQIHLLDRNDFLGARLDPVMLEVSTAIRELEQACTEQNPNFFSTQADSLDLSSDSQFGSETPPSRNSKIQTQGEASEKKDGALQQIREVEPRPEIASSPRHYIRIDRPSWHHRRPGEPNSKTILMEVDVIPAPQLKNIPPEFLDMDSIQYYIPENDPTIIEEDPFGEEWDYMLKKVYSDEAVAARKAEAAARAQKIPPAARPPAAASATITAESPS